MRLALVWRGPCGCVVVLTLSQDAGTGGAWKVWRTLHVAWNDQHPWLLPCMEVATFVCLWTQFKGGWAAPALEQNK